MAVDGTIAMSATGGAQTGAVSAASAVSLHGVAFDSLRGEPLRDAFIAVSGRVPKDTGFVYGTVRDASGEKPVANATIDVTWVDAAADKLTNIHQRRYRSQVRSDAKGGCGICGVPASVDVRVQASTDSAASGVIDLPPRDVRVQRRDLLIGKSAKSDSTRRSVIAGVVTDAAGAPFPNARLMMDEGPEARSGADGRFIIRSIPAGTRQVEVLFVGMAPVVTTLRLGVLDGFDDDRRPRDDVRRIRRIHVGPSRRRSIRSDPRPHGGSAGVPGDSLDRRREAGRLRC